ncbi:MAG TPA: 16S rRNA (cytosine(1402)-N(4))-methyltransferase RsmH [Vicinamibacterales bacterium]|nr:16S rRNA (cytosine(1402)-N(4))-methyltransferase RsmH [Vicinamibacterales bacterium]
MGHEPVLLDRVVEFFAPALSSGGVFVDATVGLGGHARAILEACPRASLVGIDRDPFALETAGTHLSAHSQRIRLVRDNFENLAAVLERLGIEKVRGVLFDLGVSSPQLDRSDRGFSYRNDGPLDMRMDPEQQLSAEDVVNSYPERDLARVISLYGEERYARRVAKGIVNARPIKTTSQLADVVKLAIPAATRRHGGHPARRTFQALRIEVNDELGALRSVTTDAVEATEPGGRVVYLSYHSLEDRIVKESFAAESKNCVCPPDFPVCKCGAQARLKLLTRRPITATEEEVAANPRASAAKLRAAERLYTPPEDAA